MKILLIGATGQVGFELSRRLAKTDHEVVRTALEASPENDVLSLDLTQLPEISKLIAEVKPDLIINAAAYTAVDKAESEQSLAQLINADAVKKMAESAKSIKAVLIHYSTDYVFDGTGEQARDESAATSPVNFYGKSKLDGEEFIRQSGCKHLIFRTSWVYGAHGHNFVKTMLRVASDRKELSVVADQVGSPTSAAQIAACTIAAVEKLGAEKDSLDQYIGTYHLTGSGFTNWAEFAKTIFDFGSEFDSKVEGVKVNPIATSEYPTPAKRPFNSRLDCSRLETIFGVQLDSWENQLKITLKEIYSAQ